ncbi:MAG: hypothetical protein KA974_08815 [Saprospiraceae bacterium]|nr:hypothetical protein [Saprospiraceae bacterium]
MKFATYLVEITGVSIYPIISLVLFMVFFLLVTLMIWGIDNRQIEHIERLPLDNQDEQFNNQLNEKS